MIKWLWITILAVMAYGQQAQAQSNISGAEPILEVVLENTEAIPGQPVILRITVLVPSWLSEPVAFPSFEIPNLLVRLPQSATLSTSRRIEGDTWAGVTRKYRLTPMVAGQFSIPPQAVTISWSDPDAGPAQEIVRMTPIVSFAGVVPEAAADLEPFLAAQSIELVQEVTQQEMPLLPGESVTRTVTVEITGTSPMFLPALLSDDHIQGAAMYPSEPIVTEHETQGNLSGRRIESVTYVAESGGSGELAPVTLRWYNLTSGKIESSTAKGVSLTIDAPIVKELDRLVLIKSIVAILLGITALYLYWRFARPVLRKALALAKSKHMASEKWAYSQVCKSIAAQDYTWLVNSLDVWAARCSSLDPGTVPVLNDARLLLGRSRYGRTSGSTKDAWGHLKAAVHTARKLAQNNDKEPDSLPELNPGDSS